jgi:biopolymer transport protein ExbD
VDETLTDIDGVKSSVKRLHAQNPKANVVIQPDPRAKTDLMIRVLDQSRAADVNASISPLFEE